MGALALPSPPTPNTRKGIEKVMAGQPDLHDPIPNTRKGIENDCGDRGPFGVGLYPNTRKGIENAPTIYNMRMCLTRFANTRKGIENGRRIPGRRRPCIR